MSTALAPAVGAPRRAAAPPRCQALPTHGPSSPPPSRRVGPLGSRRGSNDGARVAAFASRSRAAAAGLSGEELDAMFDDAVPGNRRSTFRSLLAARRVRRAKAAQCVDAWRWRPRLTPPVRRAARKPLPTWRPMRPGPAGWPWCAPRGRQLDAPRRQRRRRMQAQPPAAAAAPCAAARGALGARLGPGARMGPGCARSGALAAPRGRLAARAESSGADSLPALPLRLLFGRPCSSSSSASRRSAAAAACSRAWT